MTVASRRSEVVLPAPSGPTRPNSSPRPTSRSSRSTAVTPANLLRRPRTEMALTASGGKSRYLQVQHGVGRHARLQDLVAVADRDLHAVDELRALFLGLDVFGSELRLLRDEDDLAGEGLARVGIDLDVDRAAQPQRSHHLGSGVDVHPEVLDVAQGEDRGPDVDHLAGLDVLEQDPSRDRRAQLGVLEIDLGEP